MNDLQDNNYNSNIPVSKHDKFKYILSILGIPIDPTYFSKGSTITRKGLDAVIKTIQPGRGNFNFVTKPIPEDKKTLFINYLRGFEMIYNEFNAKELIVKTDPLPDGSIGVSFILTADGTQTDLGNGSNNLFEQYIRFTQSGDFDEFHIFHTLSKNKQILIQNNFEIYKRLLINEQISKGLLAHDSKVWIDNQIIQLTNIESYSYMDVDIQMFDTIFKEVREGLTNNDHKKIAAALDELKKKSESNPTFFEKLKDYCKDVVAKGTIELAKEWMKSANLSEQLRSFFFTLFN